MMKDMAADATNALRKSEDGHGLIQRAKAMEQIKAALPGPPDGLHPLNTGAWFTVRSAFVSAMWYPAAVKED